MDEIDRLEKQIHENEEMDELRRNLDQSNRENKELQVKYETLLKQKDNLSEDAKGRLESVAKLSAEVSTLKDDYNHLRVKNKEQYDKIEERERKVHDLQSQLEESKK